MEKKEERKRWKGAKKKWEELKELRKEKTARVDAERKRKGERRRSRGRREKRNERENEKLRKEKKEKRKWRAKGRRRSKGERGCLLCEATKNTNYKGNEGTKREMEGEVTGLPCTLTSLSFSSGTAVAHNC